MLKRVISASRRTDLAAWYPDDLIAALKAHPPEQVHTVVVWTKNPRNLLERQDLRRALGAFRQIYVHYTITGLGGTPIEPGVPSPEDSLKMLPRVIESAGDPRRVNLRFDPVVNLRVGGRRVRNLESFEEVAGAAARMGVRTVTVSWVEVYKKVVRRFAARGIRAADFDRDAQAARLRDLAASLGLDLRFCCAPGLPSSRCIDGELLTRLHPDREPCSTAKARGQRPLCGCAESLDVGWYSQTCRGKCLYCYARPEEDP
ncbi:MAG: DUF1848 family protein [Elusimicrobiota bacterium]